MCIEKLLLLYIFKNELLLCFVDLTKVKFNLMLNYLTKVNFACFNRTRKFSMNFLNLKINFIFNISIFK